MVVAGLHRCPVDWRVRKQHAEPLRWWQGGVRGTNHGEERFVHRDLIRDRPSFRLAAVSAYALFSVLDIPRSTRLLTAPSGDLASLWGASYYLSPMRLLLVLGLLLVVLSRRAWSAEHRSV